MIKNISLLYLGLVPFLAVVLAFAVGHAGYTTYLPLWLLNGCIMVAAAWILGANLLAQKEHPYKQLAATALLLILPWIFISLFAGFGPPPASIAGWMALATEQQVRYYILIGSGISVAIGFALLKQELQQRGDNFYTTIGFTAITIAIPLFIINMTYWGSYLTESFRSFEAAPAAGRPVWYLSNRQQFYSIAIVEVALIYLATAAFAAAIKKTGLLSRTVCHVYISISFVAGLLSLMPPGWPEPFSTISYAVSIPAFPFIMPCLMGIGLLRRAGR